MCSWKTAINESVSKSCKYTFSEKIKMGRRTSTDNEYNSILRYKKKKKNGWK